MMNQRWNPETYAENARFVSELGADVLELLAPRPGERILDLGCGDGVLTRRIAERGSRVVGLDPSAEFVAAARRLGLPVMHASALDMQFDAEFDAVFSNAALHWILQPVTLIARVARALRPGGRFVAEMGGHGCIETIHSALIEELDRRGYDGRAASPWYFPTAENYGALLASAGLQVRSMVQFPRPTPLPGDVMGWLTTFSDSFTAVLPAAQRAEYLTCVRQRVEPRLRDARGHWVADYVRLRFAAYLPPRSPPRTDPY